MQLSSTIALSGGVGRIGATTGVSAVCRAPRAENLCSYDLTVIWTFGEYAIDTDVFELRRDGERCPVEPKVFDVLRVLVEHRDRVVSKVELLDSVWSGEVVNESVVPRCVTLARQALGDDRSAQRIIKTVHGRGYRFVADVVEVDREDTVAPQPADSAPEPLVGRDDALAQLDKSLSEAIANRGRVVLLLGEPGIGKTATVEYQIARSSNRADVHIGRCFEWEGSPPYWPFVQILRSVSGDRANEDGATLSPSEVEDLASLMPEMAARSGPADRTERAPGEQSRFRLFDALSRLLARISRRTPLLVVVDDLHWADRDSVELFGFLARQIRDHAICLVGTYRDTDVRRGHPLRSVLGDLARLAHCDRVSLRGLAESEVRQIVERVVDRPISDGVALTVADVTRGNPFFVQEIARILAHDTEALQDAEQAGLILPQGVRDAVGRRLETMSEQSVAILRDASVLGREFDARLLAEIRSESHGSYLEWLQEGLEFGVIEGLDERERFRFSHALVQQTLYEELTAAEKVRAHRSAAEAIERLYGENASRQLGELSYHLFECAVEAGAERSVEVSLRAAHQALDQCAYAEAVDHHARAVRAFELFGRDDEARHCELLLGEAEARWVSGQHESARARFRTACEIARRCERNDLFARAAIGIRGYRYLGLAIESDLGDLLEESLDRLGDRFPSWKARVCSRLVFTEPHCFSLRERRRLVDAATSEPFDQDDATVLFDVLTARYWALLGPDQPRERIDLGQEAIRSGRRLGSSELVLLGHEVLIGANLMIGQLGEMASHVSAFERLADELRQPVFQFLAFLQQSTFAMNCGRFKLAREYLDKSAERCRLGNQRAESLIDGARYWLRAAVGEPSEPGEYERSFRELIEQTPLHGSAQIIKAGSLSILARSGRVDEARAGLSAITSRIEELEHDEHWLITLSLLAEVAVELRDVDVAQLLIDQLRPYEALVFTHDLIPATNGTVGSAIGALVGVLGRSREAADRLEAAVAWEDAIGARPAALRSRIRLANVWHATSDEGRAVDAANSAWRLAETLECLPVVSAALPWARETSR
ncbi:MAG: AAA family ATPase [bacterium]|nr:AAA family ATPase [bacterium]